MLSSHIVRQGLTMHAVALTTVLEELQKNPSVTLGQHYNHGKPVLVLRYRVNQDGKTMYREISASTKKGRKYLQIAQRNAELKKLLRELNSERLAMLELLTNNYKKASNHHSFYTGRFSYEEWCALQEANDTDIPNGYRHGKRIFRSKSEMLIAQILEEMGLEYKYEPIISVIGQDKWPDFAVYCPEIGRYFFIEHLGMMGKMNYRLDNIEKIEAYEKAGIRDGVDILYTWEFTKGGFNTAAVKGKIMGLLLAQA